MRRHLNKKRQQFVELLRLGFTDGKTKHLPLIFLLYHAPLGDAS